MIYYNRMYRKIKELIRYDTSSHEKFEKIMNTENNSMNFDSFMKYCINAKNNMINPLNNFNNNQQYNKIIKNKYRNEEAVYNNIINDRIKIENRINEAIGCSLAALYKSACDGILCEQEKLSHAFSKEDLRKLGNTINNSLTYYQNSNQETRKYCERGFKITYVLLKLIANKCELGMKRSIINILKNMNRVDYLCDHFATACGKLDKYQIRNLHLLTNGSLYRGIKFDFPN